MNKISNPTSHIAVSIYVRMSSVLQNYSSDERMHWRNNPAAAVI